MVESESKKHMSESEFRKKMKELGYEDEYIKDCIRMYNFELSLGIEIMPLEKYVSPKRLVTGYPSFSDGTDSK